MVYTVTRETFSRLYSYRSNHNGNPQLSWNSIFTLPEWMQNWWQTFGRGEELCLCSVRQEGEVIGIAPLQVNGQTASFVGSTDVCDYVDFIVAPGKEEAFFNVLLDKLMEEGLTALDLGHLKPDSTAYAGLVDIAEQRNHEVTCYQEQVTLEVDLPDTWDDYLASLSKKQRHEVRRKLRRIDGAGEVRYHTIEEGPAIGEYMDVFFSLFTASREDKESFLTPAMESFLRSMVSALSSFKLLKLGVLELNEQPVAMVIYFDHLNSFLLYNSAYDPRYASLSVGLVSKVMCIRDSIEKGRDRFDFLKGREPYKYHLGGTEIPLYRCRITLKP